MSGATDVGGEAEAVEVTVEIILRADLGAPGEYAELAMTPVDRASHRERGELLLVHLARPDYQDPAAKSVRPPWLALHDARTDLFVACFIAPVGGARRLGHLAAAPRDE